MDKDIDIIIEALKIAISKCFKEGNYEEETKFDQCLLRVQALKRDKEVFADLCEKTINVFEKTIDLYCPQCKNKYIRYEVSEDGSKCPNCNILLKVK